MMGAMSDGAQALDWTVDPQTGRSNSSEQFTRLVGEVERLVLASSGTCLSREWARGTAALVMAQLAHVHGLRPEGSGILCCVCWLTGEGDPAPAAVIVNGLSACFEHAAYCQGGELAAALRLLAERREARGPASRP